MAHYYSFAPHQNSLTAQSAFPTAVPSHNHHGNRSRRSARFGIPQNTQRSVKVPRIHKDGAEDVAASNVRKDYEAARSFDLEDDEIFCPWHLLTDDDVSCQCLTWFIV